ncbi:MAG: ABC transporter ATP-binding protein [Victivallales bacterium]|jgi:ABC-2 type transport system ATP-binding protein|nr:ABC transporter ATP-binding protein [Victivallales bacterium]
MEIKVQNLVRTFGSTRAVDDISFEFASGNIFGFIGPNGAGKTTTIKIMATLDLPNSGDVFYDGVSVVDYPEEVRRIIGYMPDSLPDFRDIQVWEYLDFFARTFGLKGEARSRTLAEVEEFTKLGDIRHKYLAGLSKGMKQRVSLARALVHNPGVLILDEPAAGLDPRARHELRELLKILSEQGKAILLSSHILSELQDICDGAVIIEKGKLLSAGSLDKLCVNSPDAKATVTILIQCVKTSEARLKLLEHPAVTQVLIPKEGELQALISGGDEFVPPVMATLFAAGLPVMGFVRQAVGLEEFFLRITTGEVQ